MGPEGGIGRGKGVRRVGSTGVVGNEADANASGCSHQELKHIPSLSLPDGVRGQAGGEQKSHIDAKQQSTPYTWVQWYYNTPPT